jgi:hypothetical protein
MAGEPQKPTRNKRTLSGWPSSTALSIEDVAPLWCHLRGPRTRLVRILLFRRDVMDEGRFAAEGLGGALSQIIARVGDSR